MKRDGKIAEIEGERVNWSHEGGCLKKEGEREGERRMEEREEEEE